MAVSGSKNYALTASTIIEKAHRGIGVYDAGEPIDGDDITSSLISLNLMIKEWMAEGIDLFLRAESTLFLQPNTNSYALSTANITDSYVETTLTAAVAAAATVMPVTSSTGMTAADFIGIKLTDNTIHWDTIATVDSSTQVTLTTGVLTAAASANKVYSYTTKSSRPQKLLFAFRRDINDFDTEITIIGENEYQTQSNKTSDGPPVEIWYNPRGNQTTGTLRVWPDNGGKNWDKIVLIAQYLPDDFDLVSHNADFPIEYGSALIAGLKAEIAGEHNVSEREQARLYAVARYKLETALAYDEENASVIFAMDTYR